MTLDLQNIGITISLAGLIGVLVFTYNLGVKQARIDLKVDTMWNFMLRRGIGEAVQKGLAELNSPVLVKPEVLQWLDPIAPELKKFYSVTGKKLTEPELAFEIERRFGDELMALVCFPQKIYMGACLIIAMQVASGKTLDLPQLRLV